MIFKKKDILDSFVNEASLWDNVKKERSKNKTHETSKDENFVLEVVTDLFSITEDSENPSFYISKENDKFGKPSMEKDGDCFHVNVNPNYKDLSFVFEVINDMYENNEFAPLMSESSIVCEECFELAIEKRLTEDFDKWILKDTISEDVKYHIKNNIPLLENVYRPGSDKHIELIKETRILWEKKMIKLSTLDSKLFEDTDLGLFEYYEGNLVPLDLPFTDDTLEEAKYHGKDVALNKPHRGGSKKFYVYVRKKGGGVKKVSFGDTTGLSVKINDPKARKSFAARHNCANKKDKTMAGYWACRLPRYASLLGLKSKFGGFW